MAAPHNLQISFSPLTLKNGGSAAIDGSVVHVSGDSSTNTNPIDNPAQVFIHVTTPPTAGTITVGGVPSRDFTLAQAQAGLVLYHNDIHLSVTSDSFSVWARCNEGSTALPFTPHFVTTATANATGATEAGLYFGTMLVGATDANIFSSHFSSPSGTNNPFTVTTTTPDSVLLVCFVAYAGRLGVTVPPAVTVTSISFAGLTFTRLSQQIQSVYQPSFAGGNTMNLTMEVWWARAPVAVSGTFTLTTPSLGTTGAPLRTDVTVFSGLANPSAPFDTNASNFQQFISTAPPWTGMAMTPDAPEYRVLPWVYEYVAGNVAAVSPIAVTPGTLPKGYGTVNGEADTINGMYAWHSAGRGPAFATASILFEPALAMDNLLVSAPAPAEQMGHLIFLDWSDDRGHSFGSPVGHTIGETGKYLTTVQYQRLGYARDRIWRLTWSVPVATALQGAWIEVDASAKS